MRSSRHAVKLRTVARRAGPSRAVSKRRDFCFCAAFFSSCVWKWPGNLIFSRHTGGSHETGSKSGIVKQVENGSGFSLKCMPPSLDNASYSQKSRKHNNAHVHLDLIWRQKIIAHTRTPGFSPSALNGQKTKVYNASTIFHFPEFLGGAEIQKLFCPAIMYLSTKVGTILDLFWLTITAQTMQKENTTLLGGFFFWSVIFRLVSAAVLVLRVGQLHSSIKPSPNPNKCPPTRGKDQPK